MEYTSEVKKLIMTKFKTPEDFYKERDRQIEKAQKEVKEYNMQIKKLEEKKGEVEKTLSQLLLLNALCSNCLITF